jgi:hypothetical protein
MRKSLMILIAVAVPLAGCGHGASSSGGTQTVPGATTGAPRPAQFADRIDNPWFPLLPGMKWIYRGIKDGEPSRDVVTVPGDTKTIQGVKCTVVKDMLYINGQLEERTTDWYAQDKSGTVWYFGEDTAELKPNGAVKSTGGSWLSGRDGAEAGIFMPASPKVGQTARQEYFKGQAEDHFEVLSLPASVKTPGASSMQALLTKEWTPLEPDVIDHKIYVRGIGVVKEITVKGPLEKNILIQFTKG